MRKALFFTMAATFTIGLLAGMTGCGEDEEEEKEPAKLLQTDPADGGKISANGSVFITFDSAVSEVKVNETAAEVVGTRATWKGQALQVGSQTLKIEWVDENGNAGSQDITLTVEVADTVPPEVAEVGVEDGSTVDPGKLNTDGIVVKFSERIDTSKSKDAFALVAQGSEFAWTPEWSDGDTQATLRPGLTSKLRSGSEYTLTISSYFDTAGNPGNAVEVTFSTTGVDVPTDDLMLWLRADEGITLRGSSVSEWADQSGNGTDAVQAANNSQPALEENAVNGLPAASFDGSDDFMTFTLPIDGLTGMTIALVSAATEDIEPPWPYCANAAIFWNETASWGTAHLTPLQRAVWIRFGTGQTQPLPVQYDYESPIGDQFTIAAAVMDGVMDYLYINGELVLENEKPAGQEALGHQRDLGNIGRGYDDNTYFPGMIAEVLIYTRTLSDAERQQLEKYLSDKYSIQ